MVPEYCFAIAIAIAIAIDGPSIIDSEPDSDSERSSGSHQLTATTAAAAAAVDVDGDGSLIVGAGVPPARQTRVGRDRVSERSWGGPVGGRCRTWFPGAPAFWPAVGGPASREQSSVTGVATVTVPSTDAVTVAVTETGIPLPRPSGTLLGVPASPEQRGHSRRPESA